MSTLFNHVFKLKQRFNEVAEEVNYYLNPGEGEKNSNATNDLIQKLQKIKNDFQSLPTQTDDAKVIDSAQQYVQQADILLSRIRI